MTSPVVISELQADYQDTERSTAQTVKEMGRHIRECANDPEVIRVARACVDSQHLGRMWRAAQVWAWLKRNVVFVTDDEQLRNLLGRGDELELLISPAVLIRNRERAGDCDDFTMLCCAMLGALGVPAFIKTFKCDRAEPWRWAHVCAAAVLEDGSVFPLDASHGDYPGWQVPSRDQFDWALWDLDGRIVKRGKPMYTALSGYRKLKSWTGDPMTTLSGPAIDPYPQLDVMRYWHPIPGRVSPAQRQRGLGAIARGRFTKGMGLGQDGSGEAGSEGSGIPGDPTSYESPISNPPLAPGQVYNAASGTIFDPLTGDTINAQTGAIISGPVLGSSPVVSTPGGGFNLNQFLSNLFGAGTKLGSQALLTPGTVMLPNGTIVAGTPQGTSNVTLGGISSGTLLIGALVIGGVLLLSGKR